MSNDYLSDTLTVLASEELDPESKVLYTALSILKGPTFFDNSELGELTGLLPSKVGKCVRRLSELELILVDWLQKEKEAKRKISVIFPLPSTISLLRKDILYANKKITKTGKDSVESLPVLSSRREALKVKRKPKLTLTKKENFSVEVREVIDCWSNLNFKKPRRGTKVYDYDIIYVQKMLNGTLFNDSVHFTDYKDTPFSVEDFKKTIALYKQDMDLKVFKFDRYLHEFLFQAAIPGTKINETSLFITYFKKKGVIGAYNKNNNPALTEAISSIYKTRTLGKSPRWELSPSDYDKIIAAANKLENFFKSNKILNGSLTAVRKAKYLYEAVLADVKCEADITPGYFSSDLTFTRRLPSHLRKVGATTSQPIKRQIGKGLV